MTVIKFVIRAIRGWAMQKSAPDMRMRSSFMAGANVSRNAFFAAGCISDSHLGKVKVRFSTRCTNLFLRVESQWMNLRSSWLRRSRALTKAIFPLSLSLVSSRTIISVSSGLFRVTIIAWFRAASIMAWTVITTAQSESVSSLVINSFGTPSVFGRNCITSAANRASSSMVTCSALPVAMLPLFLLSRFVFSLASSNLCFRNGENLPHSLAEFF